MAARGRFGRWTPPSFSVSATPIVRQFNAANVATASTTSNMAATPGGSGGFNLTQAIADDYDISPSYVPLLFNPSAMNEGNKYAAAGGTDRKTAQRPVFLRQPGDRMPTAFELRNQAFYDPSREPIVGEGGKTLNPKDGSLDSVWEFVLNGYIPPAGSAARATMEAELTPGHGTLQNAINNLGLTSQLGQGLVEYNPAGLTKLTAAEKAAIPFSGAVVFDRFRGGWTVAPEVATSPNNFPAYQGNMIPDDPNFQYTKNPPAWIIPGVATVQSIPGSGSTVGFNTELGQWMTRPSEVGEKTTWELAATNPNTGQIDPSMITREVAVKLNEFGNLPSEFQYLMTDAKPWGYWSTQTPTTTTPRKETPGGGTPTPPPAPPKPPKETTPTVAPVTQRPGPSFGAGTTTPSAPAVKPQQPISIPKMTAL